jgi:hypothetical protein
MRDRYEKIELNVGNKKKGLELENGKYMVFMYLAVSRLVA